MCATKTLCFYYPTTVVIVDDNRPFLENLPENLENKAIFKLFDSPKEALEFLQRQQFLPEPDTFLGLTDDLASGASLNVNIPKIRTRLQDKNRFNMPTVIIVDYDMPGMSGLEFCQRLANHPVKKIMLTGIADHRLAVQAFNDSIINQFITKDDPNVFDAIDQAVHMLQQEYFAHLSDLIVKNITTATFSFLGNKAFQDFFAAFLKENNIVEFYLTDAIGSFLLINNKGEHMRLVIQSDQEIENYHLTAQDHNAPVEIINALAGKEKLLCLFSEEDFNLPVDKWAAYLHKAYRMTNVEGCYYSIAQAK